MKPVTLILSLYGVDVVRSKPIASATEAALRVKAWQTTYLRTGSVRAEEADGTVVELPSPINMTVRLPE